ncbi:phosphonate metabolism transcriptional regulator PhnF [Aliiroseovarius sp.]|uniref:phosphonate metabolism transcriptional regulator PhnF n=1 Tax=Aliiroseovarius sp. TaxID=1872442 RepID=UPI003BAA2B77
MPRTPVWKSIARALSGDIAEGRYAPGDKLPTEAELSSRFGVNRHTLRRAIADMAERGLVQSRRGSGVFVLAEPTEYPIGRRVRFHQNLTAAGRLPAKRILTLETRASDTREAKALGLPPGDLVHCYDGLSLADNVPVALFRSVFPAAPFPNLLRDLEETRSVTKALEMGGVRDYTRAHTRLTAKRATGPQAVQLNIHEGDPILRTVGVNVDPGGRAVEYGRTWFVGDRMTLVVDDR